jgi:hypothetical protein
LYGDSQSETRNQQSEIKECMHHDRLYSFAQLGNRISAWLCEEAACPALNVAVQQSVAGNPWFTRENIRKALAAIATDLLDEHQLQRWLSAYPAVTTAKRVGVVMAGNIPLVGFHDFLCVLAAGHFFTGKLSHKDPFLLPALAEILVTINSEWRNRITFTEELQLGELDKLIATGSDQTARYFEQLAAAFSHNGTGTRLDTLIRHNRRSVALLTGHETVAELNGLADDLFSYFGWGCRNVSMLYVPSGYDWQALTAALSRRKELLEHTGYAHNYRYQKALLAMQAKPFRDASVALLCEDHSLQAPPAVVHYRYYRDWQEALTSVEQQREQIQCVVAAERNCNNFCTFGNAQHPPLDDYADGVDTMKWL